MIQKAIASGVSFAMVLLIGRFQEPLNAHIVIHVPNSIVGSMFLQIVSSVAAG